MYISQNNSGLGQAHPTGEPLPPITNTSAAAATAGQSPIKAVLAPGEVPNAEQLKQATDLINSTIQSLSRNLEFTVDSSTHTTVVKVMDVDTNQLIRQIPSQEVLAIAKALDNLQGLLIRQKV